MILLLLVVHFLGPWHEMLMTLLTLLFSWFVVVIEFPTTRTELNAVFDIFDRHRTGEINYSEFMEALRPERQVGLLFPLNV